MGMKWKQIRMSDVGSLVHRWVAVNDAGEETGDNSVESVRKKLKRESAPKVVSIVSNKPKLNLV
jgi:hypothetical protein